jgi:hypothetical protein
VLVKTKPVLEKAMTETAMEGILLVRNIVVEREGARERKREKNKNQMFY